MTKVAIIGGTGHRMPENLKKLKSSEVITPYGVPGSDLYTGKVNGREMVYLPRLGSDDSLRVTGVNHMANLYALKDLGCRIVLATSECASLQEEICPGDFIIPDQGRTQDFGQLSPGKPAGQVHEKKPVLGLDIPHGKGDVIRAVAVNMRHTPVITKNRHPAAQVWYGECLFFRVFVRNLPDAVSWQQEVPQHRY